MGVELFPITTQRFTYGSHFWIGTHLPSLALALHYSILFEVTSPSLGGNLPVIFPELWVFFSPQEQATWPTPFLKEWGSRALICTGTVHSGF